MSRTRTELRQPPQTTASPQRTQRSSKNRRHLKSTTQSENLVRQSAPLPLRPHVTPQAFPSFWVVALLVLLLCAAGNASTNVWEGDAHVSGARGRRRSSWRGLSVSGGAWKHGPVRTRRQSCLAHAMPPRHRWARVTTAAAAHAPAACAGKEGGVREGGGGIGCVRERRA